MRLLRLEGSIDRTAEVLLDTFANDIDLLVESLGSPEEDVDDDAPAEGIKDFATTLAIENGSLQCVRVEIEQCFFMEIIFSVFVSVNNVNNVSNIIIIIIISDIDVNNNIIDDVSNDDNYDNNKQDERVAGDYV